VCLTYFPRTYASYQRLSHELMLEVVTGPHKHLVFAGPQWKEVWNLNRPGHISPPYTWNIKTWSLLPTAVFGRAS